MIYFYFFKNFFRPFLFLFSLLATGSFGYMYLEKWNFTDSLYMTAITISTVGFGEIHPLSSTGRLFTIVLLVGGVGFYGIVLNTLIRNFVDTKFRELVTSIRMNTKIENMKDHYIICGGGRMAYTIGLELERSQKEFLFIENSTDSPVMEKKDHWPIIQKDALLEQTLEEAGIRRAKGLASVLQTDADNLFIVLSAKRLNPDLYIVTRIAFESTQSKMLQAGATKVVSPYAMGGMQIARSFIYPEVSEFLEVVMDKASYEFEFQIHTVTEEDPYKDKRIRDASFRENGYIVISLRYPDGRLVFAPDANFVLEKDIEILLLGGGEKILRDANNR